MTLAQAVAAYVASKQSLGMRFATEARTLKSFCRSIGDVDIDQIEALLPTEQICVNLTAFESSEDQRTRDALGSVVR